MKTKVSIILVCLTMMASSLSATVYNGVCGEHLTWTYDTGTGDMIIEGYGKLEKTVDSLWWNSPVVQIAQYSNNYKATSPKRVILPEGVTSICSGAFSNFALMANLPRNAPSVAYMLLAIIVRQTRIIDTFVFIIVYYLRWFPSTSYILPS